MEENNISNNNKTEIIDCLGSCKTPIGCTCGKIKDSELSTGEQLSEIKVGDVISLEPKGAKTCCKTKGKCCQNKGSNKLEVYNWLSDLPESQTETQMVEVQFKNTRKGYFLNSNELDLNKGDLVAVESTPGHDIGEVTLTGRLVLLQMKKNNYRVPANEHKRVYRLAKNTDLEKQAEAKKKEHPTMLRAREIAERLELQMKISDVEYQGDGNKAIFYYIADDRVDFRELIKRYAEAFHVKIEMKQIGARQEAGRVGGIGPCGRELCCSSSVSSFVSVSTSAARYQDISLNPQKLAGLCGKLKCCLNYEVDTYVEAQRGLPSREILLDTKDSTFFHFKTDILSGQMTYSTDKRFAANLVTLDKERVFEIIRMNKGGKRPMKLDNVEVAADDKFMHKDLLEQENITRFDKNTPAGDRQRRKKKVLRAQDDDSSAERSKDNNQGTQPSPQKILTKGAVLPKPKIGDEGVENQTVDANKVQNKNRNNKKSRRNFNKNGNNADTSSPAN